MLLLYVEVNELGWHHCQWLELLTLSSFCDLWHHCVIIFKKFNELVIGWESIGIGITCVFHENVRHYILLGVTLWCSLTDIFARFSLRQQRLFIMCDVDAYVIEHDILRVSDATEDTAVCRNLLYKNV